MPITALHSRDADFIVLLKNKDPKAFSEVYDLYSKALYSIIFKIVSDAEEAEDILQNTFLKFWNSFESYDTNKGKIYTWLLQIARNTALDHIRSRYHQEKKQTFSHEILKENNISIESNVLDTIGLSSVVNKMKEEHILLFELFYYEGFSQEEVSKELNIPLGTVKTRLRKALLLLREELKDKIQVQ